MGAVANPSRTTLVDCSVDARDGVRFDLRLTDKFLTYGRRKVFAVSDPYEMLTIDRGKITNVVLKKKSSMVLRAIGAAMILGTTAIVVAFIVGQLEVFYWASLLGYVLGGACLFGSSNRWQLSFSDGKRTHKLVQPLASDKHKMNAMAQALRTTAAHLQSPGEADPGAPREFASIFSQWFGKRGGFR